MLNVTTLCSYIESCYAECCYAGCRNAECYYAECCMLSVVVMLRVILLSAAAPIFTTVSYVPEISSDVHKFISFPARGSYLAVSIPPRYRAAPPPPRSCSRYVILCKDQISKDWSAWPTKMYTWPADKFSNLSQP